MRSITRSGKRAVDLGTAEMTARQAIEESGQEHLLVSWYDNDRMIGGPAEACGDGPLQCVNDYATTHGAELHVRVNNFEFFFISVPQDFLGLEQDELVSVHTNLAQNEYENFMGG